MSSPHAPHAPVAGSTAPPPTAPPTVRMLRGRLATAAWGAPFLLAPFLDAVDAVEDPAHADGLPAAELWFGAHAARPSPVATGPAADGTAAWTSADRLPADERPPVLVKLLAAGAPLSIQVHPDDATAAARSPEGPVGKPELLRALGPMRILCGLRPAAASRTLLSRLAPDAAPLLEALGHGDEGLGEAVALALRADRTTRAELLTAVEDGARALLAASDAAGPERAGEDGGTGTAAHRAARLALDLLDRFPGDPGVLVALLLEDVDLAPGTSVFVAPGTPHAYLSGLGLEVMPPSDQVLRGGLTVKPIDVEGFLDVLDAGRTGVPSTGVLARDLAGGGWRRHVLPSDAFVADEADVDGRPLAVERSGPGAGLLVCVAGAVHVRAADGSVADLEAGTAALLAPGGAAVEVDGRGAVIHATCGQPGAA